MTTKPGECPLVSPEFSDQCSAEQERDECAKVIRIVEGDRVEVIDSNNGKSPRYEALQTCC
jgi:hypothetical protein